MLFYTLTFVSFIITFATLIAGHKRNIFVVRNIDAISFLLVSIIPVAGWVLSVIFCWLVITDEQFKAYKISTSSSVFDNLTGKK